MARWQQTAVQQTFNLGTQMKINKCITAFILSLVLVNPALASVILTNGSVVNDAGTDLTEFSFTLEATADVSLSQMVLDGDSGAVWGAAATLISSNPDWTPGSIQPIDYYVGAFTPEVAMSTGDVLDFSWIFSGLSSVVGGTWQVTIADSISGDFLLFNDDLATGPAARFQFRNRTPLR